VSGYDRFAATDKESGNFDEGSKIMAQLQPSLAGKVVSIWRYPVKSMLGEELNSTLVTQGGLIGDRRFALVDVETGKIASAKNPRRWPNLFDFRATYIEPPGDANALPAVRISCPDGEQLTTSDASVESRISAAVGRSVKLASSAVAGAAAEGYWPDHDWLSQRDEVFEFPLPPGTFFDGASALLMTTRTLDALRKQAPASRFEVPRFRPNLVIEPASGFNGFVENDWIGRNLQVGEVQFRIDGPCPRCIMTTLGQASLPKDPDVLRTAVKHNGGNVGVYATVVRAGRIRRGDEALLS
jgi:uncharacterized protein YcbX